MQVNSTISRNKLLRNRKNALRSQERRGQVGSTNLQLYLQAEEGESSPSSGPSSKERNFSRELWQQQGGALSPLMKAVHWGLDCLTEVPGLTVHVLL